MTATALNANTRIKDGSRMDVGEDEIVGMHCNKLVNLTYLVD